MPSSGLRGPYKLSTTSVNLNVTCTSPGAYALGYTKNNTFYIKYVGRSDSDVNDRLKDHVSDYSQFKFEYYSTAKLAFEKECRLYHDFDPTDNDVHPARPRGKTWECPVCTIFDN